MDAPHGLEVVREDVRLAFAHDADRVRVGAEVRREDLDAAARVVFADGADRRGPDGRAAVRADVVARHTGDDGVLEADGGGGLRDTLRLAGVDVTGTSGDHVAERAAARADVAEDEERRRALLPALVDVRARSGLLAHRVQVVLAHQAAQLEEVLALTDLDLQPVRLLLRAAGPDVVQPRPRARDLERALHD